MSGVKNRGFASMDKDRLLAITSAAGKAAHAMGKAHEWSPEDARRVGRIGEKFRKGSKWDRLFNVHPKE